MEWVAFQNVLITGMTCRRVIESKILITPEGLMYNIYCNQSILKLLLRSDTSKKTSLFFADFQISGSWTGAYENPENECLTVINVPIILNISFFEFCRLLTLFTKIIYFT